MSEDLELEKIRLKRMQAILKNKEPIPAIKVPNGVIHINDQNFQKIIQEYSTKIPVFVDYWAEWCQPCKYVSPIIEALEKRYRGKILFTKLNVDENRLTSTRFRISSIPTFHIFKNGKIFDQFMGALPAQQFEAKIKKALKNAN
ncbi:MAG: thioredoxin [Candidatus Hodarchaeales archaeon]|jgi:thioredoxin 1